MAFTTPGTAVAGDVLTAAFWNLQVRDNINSLVEAGSSLPSSPIDGQSFYYTADTTNGIVWHLRYRSAAPGSYKWEFVGGQPLTSFIATSQTRANTAYGDLATVGPSITAPLAGDYIITIGNYSQSANTGDVAIMSYTIGGTAADDGRSTRGSDKQGNPAMVKSHTGISASTAFVMKYRNLTGTATFSDRYMTLIPVRVG